MLFAVLRMEERTDLKVLEEELTVVRCCSERRRLEVHILMTLEIPRCSV